MKKKTIIMITVSICLTLVVAFLLFYPWKRMGLYVPLSCSKCDSKITRITSYDFIGWKETGTKDQVEQRTESFEDCKHDWSQ